MSGQDNMSDSKAEPTVVLGSDYLYAVVGLILGFQSGPKSHSSEKKERKKKKTMCEKL